MSQLADAIREVARLEKKARDARRALRALQDEQGEHLGQFALAAGERLDEMDLIQFVRLAVGTHTDREIRITVTAPRGADQGDEA